MPRKTRQARPQELGESWASMSSGDDDAYEDDPVDGASSEEEPLHVGPGSNYNSSPLQPISELGNTPRTGGATPSSQRASAVNSPSNPRRSARKQTPSRETPVEPSFIMPSMYSELPDGSFARSSPQSQRRVRASPAASTHGTPQKATSPKVVTPRESRGPGMSSSRSTLTKGPAPRMRRHNAAKKGQEDTHASNRQDVWFVPLMAWSYVMHPALRYLWSVVEMLGEFAKPLIVYAIIFYVLFLAVSSVRNGISAVIYSTLSPICSIPGMSYANLPFCRPSGSYPGRTEFEQLVGAQTAFEDVLSSSTEFVSLPYNMKQSEASVRDLRTVIKYSSLPSRNELVFELGGFIDAARQASSDLATFESHIGRAVDNILSTNRWTLSVLDSLARRESDRGALSRLLTAANPLAPRGSASEAVLRQYLQHARAVEDQVNAVIAEAQGLELLLGNLDERLDVIGEISSRDGVAAAASREELLAYLWTRLGGNRADVARLEQHLGLLRSVKQYQSQAWQHVAATLLKLQAVSAQLEDLRERVAAPEVAGAGAGADMPLEFHIENVRLGVERLEDARGANREKQGEMYRKLIGGGGAGGGAGRNAAEGRMVEDGGAGRPVVREANLV